MGEINNPGVTRLTSNDGTVTLSPSTGVGQVDLHAAGGGGGITGPGTSTNTAIPTWNGTAGTALNNSGVTIDASNNVATPGTITGAELIIPQIAYNAATPAVSSTGMVLYARQRANKTTLNMLDPSGVDAPISPNYGFKTIKTIIGVCGTSNFNFPGNGMAVITTGTLTAFIPTFSNFFNSQTARIDLVSSGSANSVTSVRNGNGSGAPFLAIGNFAGGFSPGFLYVVEGGMVTWLTGTSWLMCLAPSSTGPDGTKVATTVFTDIIGVGADPGDTNMQIMVRAASGTTAKTDLGVNFPAQTSSTDWYRLTLFSPKGSGNVYWDVERRNTGDKADGVITSGLPTIILNPITFSTSGVTASSNKFAFCKLYTETDY